MLMEITQNELVEIDGGNWKKAVAATAGSVLIAVAPAVGILTGIGASAATPVIGVAAGAVASTTLVNAGSACLDYATKK